MVEDFVFGDWEILDEDRAAQDRGEPYWTLMPTKYDSAECLTHGPFGRKVMWPEGIIEFDHESLLCSQENQNMIVMALNSYKRIDE